MATLQDKYLNEVVPALTKELEYTNPMKVPKVTKVVVNMSTNVNVDKDTFKAMTEDLALITGQRPLITKARKSISNFKLREGVPLGAKVTLRGKRMFEFLDRLIGVALPRIRDFRGVSPKGFDGRGNYNLGLNEQTYFPEVDPDKIKKSQGMDICVVTTAETDDEGRELLKRLGMPFAEA
jgi:large subunit ribosomal protein L5